MQYTHEEFYYASNKTICCYIYIDNGIIWEAIKQIPKEIVWHKGLTCYKNTCMHLIYSLKAMFIGRNREENKLYLGGIGSWFKVEMLGHHTKPFILISSNIVSIVLGRRQQKSWPCESLEKA